MSQTLSIELVNGTLALDEATLRAAHIQRQARVIVQEHSILILPAETDVRPATDALAQNFGSFRLPPELAQYFAEDKELEYDL